MPDSEGPRAPLSGRARLVQSLRRPSRGQAVVGVLLAAVGFAAVTQVHASSATSSYAGYREQDLIDLLNGLTTASQRSRDDLAKLEADRAALQDSTSKRQAALSQARQLTRNLQILTGQVPVTGPGMVVTVVGGNVTVDSMLDTIEELRTAGAEAIAINNTRLTASSFIQAAATGLLVDGTVMSGPYTLRVIGDPTLLSAAMVFAEGPKAQLEANGAAVNIQTSDKVQIMAVASAGSTQFIQPQ